MLTAKHFIYQAKALGTYVIPELCTRRDWNANGALKWDVDKVNSFHKLGTFLVDFCASDNPNFDLDKFNNKMLDHARVAINSGPYLYLEKDLPGMRLRGKESPPNSWTFYPIVTNIR